MLNIGPEKILVILAIALIVLGPTELPEAARKLGNVLRELRRLSDGFEAELHSGLQALTSEPPASPSNAPADPPSTSNDTAA